MSGVATPDPHPAGNHVVVQTAEHEFVYLAHFEQGSILVKEGDRVAVGDPLGHGGNSGNSSEPHLHIHVQDQVEFAAPDAIVLPLRFANYLADGQPVSDGEPVQGQFIARP